MKDDTVVLPAVPDDQPDDRPDGLAAELARAAPRRWHNRATLPLAGAVLLAGGFLGGALVTRQSAPAAAPGASRGGFAGGAFPGGGFRGGGAQPSEPAAGATTGKIKLVDGATIYVEMTNGTVLTVKTNGKTAVTTAKTAKLTDLEPGATVSVTGTAAGEDAITATSVTAR